MQKETRSVAKELAKGCQTIDDVHGKLKVLFKETLQEISEAEIDEHLGYEKNSPAGNNTGNSRKGYSP